MQCTIKRKIFKFERFFILISRSETSAVITFRVEPTRVVEFTFLNRIINASEKNVQQTPNEKYKLARTEKIK